MIGEYLLKIQKENEEKLIEINEKIRQLSAERNLNEDLLKHFADKTETETDFFSPRKFEIRDDHRVDEINQRNEMIRREIVLLQEQKDDLERKKEDSRKAYEELNRIDVSSVEQNEEELHDCEMEKKNPAPDMESVQDGKQEDSAGEKEKIPVSNTVSDRNQKDMEEATELLKDIFRKTEICLAMINGNRDRCKKELKEIKQLIRDFAKEKKW